MGSGKLTETTARALLLDLYEREGWKALGYESWEKWGMSKTHANRLISSAEVRENLIPMGVVPTSERQTRPITSLPPDQQRDVWEEVVRTAPAGKVTARHVEEIAERIKKQIPALASEVVVTPSDSSTLKDSYRLQELKYHWKNATKKEREAFLEWIKN